MIYSELKTRLAQIGHRSDLSSQMANFTQDATEKINRRFGLALAPLVLDTDTNEVLTNWPLLYLYAALQSLFEFTNNGDNATYFSGLWNLEADRQNITGGSSATDSWNSEPPAITVGG
jgi:hypothetical protein